MLKNITKYSKLMHTIVYICDLKIGEILKRPTRADCKSAV